MHVVFKECHTLHVISAHAPHNGDDIDTINAYWDSLDTLFGSILQGVHATMQVALCIDGNARLGSIITDSVGGLNADTESSNGHLFHAILLRHGLVR